MAEFSFYLDAWKFCVDNSLPLKCITRRDWKVWQVEYDNGD
jgi:hypothetical protein